MPSIQLLSKPGCHLCDDARASLAAVLDEGEFTERFDLSEKNILDDPALTDEYFEEIPVVLVDERVHTIWRVDRERLRTALRASLAKAAS